MKYLRWFLYFLMTLIVGIFIWAQFQNSYHFEKKYKIQSTLPKAYHYVASHEWKSHLLRNIQAEGTSIEDFKEGSESRIVYGRKGKKLFHEKIVSVDTLKSIDWIQDFGIYCCVSHIEFQENIKTVDLIVEEEIRIQSMFLRPIILLAPDKFQSVRDKFFTDLKNLIESTPDYNMKPEELK